MQKSPLQQLFFIVLFFFSTYLSNAQISTSQINGGELNTISTAVPFLTIAPDARATGFGDLGVASSPDVNSQHWNVAKYAFIDGKSGMSFTFSPWLSKIIPDINHLYLSGYYKLNDKNIFSASMRYFSLGSVGFTSTSGITLDEYTPHEVAMDAGYSRRFTEHFSAGVVLRYINSFLSDRNGAFPGESFAGDLGLYYYNDLMLGSKDVSWAIGMNISNVGTPISYTANAVKVPIPTNLRIGGRFSFDFNESHTISFMTDANKLLVPTSPVLGIDSVSGSSIVLYGYERPETIVAGMIQSFYDAPGYVMPDGSRSVFLEEITEIILSTGAEYCYEDRFAIRTGYFHEHSSKGGRKFFTLGFGIKYGILTFDVSYLLPLISPSPLSGTFRFMLSFEI